MPPNRQNCLRRTVRAEHRPRRRVLLALPAQRPPHLLCGHRTHRRAQCLFATRQGRKATWQELVRFRRSVRQAPVPGCRGSAQGSSCRCVVHRMPFSTSPPSHCLKQVARVLNDLVENGQQAIDPRQVGLIGRVSVFHRSRKGTSQFRSKAST